MKKRIAQVVVAIANSNVDKTYDYRIAEDMIVKEGTRVVVPFGVGNAKTVGYVVALLEASDYDGQKLKQILSVIDDTPVITQEMLRLARWMKEQYYTTYVKCLQCVLPTGIKSRKTMSKKVRYVSIAEDVLEERIEELIESYLATKNLETQGQVLETLYQYGRLPLNDLRELLIISESPVKTLQKKGLVTIWQEEVRRAVAFTPMAGNTEDAPVVLNAEQALAFDGLWAMEQSGQYEAALLHGITGSGKTEVYLRLIEATIQRGKQAIMLVPEISLTPQAVSRFTERFGAQVTVTHSKMTLGERYDQWKKALDGEVSIMIGPRSAVFTPFRDVGIIIIDEEHEHSYKSEITPKYDAREVAAERIRYSSGLLLLGSATPAVETYYRAQQGALRLFHLTKRAKHNPLPMVAAVDMRAELMAGNRSIFSKRLLAELGESLEKGEQSMLFLNRRGFASFVSCRKCGYVLTCEHCNVAYTYHKAGEKLVCHYCGTKIANPKTCPSCGAESIRQFGAGTQKIEQELAKHFPQARTLRMDYDTVRGKNAHETILNQFAQGEADILIGTQMIAKGHDFGNVTFVGIVAADIALNSGDFRSAETAFQLITQVAGRAGRADMPGKVVTQTYNPEHYAIVHALRQDYEGFYNEEIRLRKKMLYPPFSHLFVVLFTGAQEKSIIIYIHRLLKIMDLYKSRGDYETIGPAPCYVSKIKNRFRWKIIVKSADATRLTNFCLYCVARLKKSGVPEDINISLALDPHTTE